MIRSIGFGVALAGLAAATGAEAQSAANLAVLRGLAPVSALAKTPAGRAALGSNYAVTGGIQTGALRLPTPLPFAEQQGQALRDAFITDGNVAELADGLGTTLGAAYVARAHYLDRDHFTNLSPAIADLIAYTNATTGSDSNSGKYFFANGTKDGKAAVSDEAGAIFKAANGAPDPFGTAYGRPAGSPGADAFGDSRPFQTEPSVVTIYGLDYFGAPASSDVYNRGPISNLQDSPSYPSGHTTYGYMGSILLGVLVPDRYPQMVARAAEYGNDRILMGAHYAMDVLGGRTLATHDLAHLLANDPAYMNQSFKDGASPMLPGGGKREIPPIADYRAAVKAAQAEMAGALQAGCGGPVAACAKADIGRFSDPAALDSFVAATQTYGLPVVHPETAGTIEDVGKLAPEAGNLLTIAFPTLTLDQANAILTETEGPGGGFLDDGSAFGVYSRLNLRAAAKRAAAAVAGR